MHQTSTQPSSARRALIRWILLCYVGLIQTAFGQTFTVVQSTTTRFAADATYLVTQNVTVTGCVFEGGSVIKIRRGKTLTVSGAITFDTNPTRKVIITAEDDNTDGAILPAPATGVVTGRYAATALNLYNVAPTSVIKDLDIRHANNAITDYSNTTHTCRDISISDCDRGLSAYYTSIMADNVRMCRVFTPTYSYTQGYIYPTGAGYFSSCSLPTQISWSLASTIRGVVKTRPSIARGSDPLIGMSLLDATTGDAISGVQSSPDDPTMIEWNTMLVPNGTYSVVLRVMLGAAENPTFIDAAPKTVVVDNKVWFPDLINKAGGLIEWCDPGGVNCEYEPTLVTRVQTAYPGGTYHLEVRPASGSGAPSPLYVVDGTIDGDGFCTDAGARDLFFSLVNGPFTVWASPFYDIVVTVTPPVLAAAGGGTTQAPPVTVTNRVKVELPWTNSPTRWTLGYMPVYGSGTLSGAPLRIMMEGLHTLMGDDADDNRVVPGNPSDANELKSGAANRPKWGEWLINGIAANGVRNLFYFGHGSSDGIGGVIPKDDLDKLLINRKESGGMNRHPYRFVFLYGCETAGGTLCESFGIPKKKGLTKAHFLAQGLRPRAFVGFKKSIYVGVANISDQTHTTFVAEFFDKWAHSVYPAGHAKAGQPLGLKDALEAARVKVGWSKFFGPFSNIVIYGAEDLTFNDSLDFVP